MKKIAVISMVGGVLLIIAAAIPFGLSRRTAPADLQENAAQQGQIENREPVHTPRPFLPRPEPQPTAETEDTPTASRSLFDPAPESSTCATGACRFPDRSPQ